MTTHTKTHCINGHPLSEDNYHLRKDGKVQCLICARLSSQRWRDLHRNDNDYDSGAKHLHMAGRQPTDSLPALCVQHGDALSCPRCGARVVMIHDMYGPYVACLVCGYHRDTTQPDANSIREPRCGEDES